MATVPGSEPTDQSTEQPTEQATPAAPDDTDHATPVVDAQSPAVQPEAHPAAQPTVVFVQAPQPPAVKGARGVGALVALLGAGIFSAVYAVLVAVLALLTPGVGLVAAVRFTATPTFWIPVIVFALGYLLLVVIVNRAGWWAHVLGGFLVALVVWVGFVGAAIISAGVIGAPADVVGAVVADQLRNPIGFAAAIAAREVPIWVGGLVAKRGRTARARNAANRDAYERELAEHRATLSGTTAV